MKRALALSLLLSLAAASQTPPLQTEAVGIPADAVALLVADARSEFQLKQLLDRLLVTSGQVRRAVPVFEGMSLALPTLLQFFIAFAKGSPERVQVPGLPISFAEAAAVLSPQLVAAQLPNSQWLLKLNVTDQALAEQLLQRVHEHGFFGPTPLSGCVSNLKNIDTAIEMYRSDYAGRPPKSLKLLEGSYLREIPACPQAQRDTYSASYRPRKEGAVLACRGNHHGLGANLPTLRDGGVLPGLSSQQMRRSLVRQEGSITSLEGGGPAWSLRGQHLYVASQATVLQQVFKGGASLSGQSWFRAVQAGLGGSTLAAVWKPPALPWLPAACKVFPAQGLSFEAKSREGRLFSLTAESAGSLPENRTARYLPQGCTAWVTGHLHFSELALQMFGLQPEPRASWTANCAGPYSAGLYPEGEIWVAQLANSANLTAGSAEGTIWTVQDGCLILCRGKQPGGAESLLARSLQAGASPELGEQLPPQALHAEYSNLQPYFQHLASSAGPALWTRLMTAPAEQLHSIVSGVALEDVWQAVSWGWLVDYINPEWLRGSSTLTLESGGLLWRRQGGVPSPLLAGLGAGEGKWQSPFSLPLGAASRKPTVRNKTSQGEKLH